jgi:hypothetical protein
MEAAPVTVVAGVDIGNATTEVVVLDGERLLGAGRLPTRGRKGSAESLRGAAALVRRVERRLGTTIGEARIAPLRAVGTATLTIPAVVPDTGRLRVLAAGVTTPGGTGTCVGAPLWLEAAGLQTEGLEPASSGGDRPAGAAGGRPPDGGPAAWVALVPPSLGYVAAARRLRELLAAGVRVGAVLAGSDEGVLIANRLDVPVPVIDQVDVAAAAACARLAVEVRPPGQPLILLTDPVALAAALRLSDGGLGEGGLGNAGLGDREAADAAAVGRALLDYGNGVVGLARGAAAGAPAPELAGPWVMAHGRRIGLREACAELAGWPVGTVTALGTPDAQGTPDGQSGQSGQASLNDQASLDDLFAVDLAAAADTATARRGSVGRAVLVSSLHRLSPGRDHAAVLAGLLGCPVRCVLSEPAAARLGACTTPGARADAIVVDVGAGTIDVIAPDGEVVAAGAGELLTVAVAETLGVPRAAADWVKRGPCVRLDGNQRFEAEDGRRGFLDGPADPAGAGMLAAAGPAGWLPFDRRHSPAEWRAIRLRLKEAVFAANLARALRTLDALGTPATLGPRGRHPGQVLIVGGPAGDDELLGVLLRTLPEGVTAGRGNVGGTLAGPGAGHRHAAALGLALAPPT